MFLFPHVHFFKYLYMFFLIFIAFFPEGWFGEGPPPPPSHVQQRYPVQLTPPPNGPPMRSMGPVTFDTQPPSTNFGGPAPSPGRTIHDGFATIRASAVGLKGKRARSSPPGGAAFRSTGPAKGGAQCPGLNCGAMTPLWEERPGDRPRQGEF